MKDLPQKLNASSLDKIFVHTMIQGGLGLFLLIISGCSLIEIGTKPTAFVPPQATTSPIPMTVQNPTPTKASKAAPTPSATALPSPTTPVKTKIAPSATMTPQENEQIDSNLLFPDSEIIYSPTSLDFDIHNYINQTNGYIKNYQQYLMISGWTSGEDIVHMVALENSINPRLLLALLEHQSGCILQSQPNQLPFEYAMGAYNYYREDLYGQLVWAVHVLSEGFYGRLNGQLNQISFSDGTIFTPPSSTNAGTFAIEYFFAQLYQGKAWQDAIDPANGFPALYSAMFGNPWERDKRIKPLLPNDLTQPKLELPFPLGEVWAYTGGPHPAFENNGPWASLDFAPPTDQTGCYKSDDWVVAMSDGYIVRSGNGIVIQDLDEDHKEQTGWALMYLHIDNKDMVKTGTYLHTGEKIGHPSCEGGRATGTHVHVTRKYNGVWMSADGAVPFVLSGWTAHAGNLPYQGTLTRGDETITANQYGNFASRIAHDE